MLEKGSLFALGGTAYLAVELAWRGSTHWTMFAAGGVCLCLLEQLAAAPWPLAVSAGAGAGVITATELAVGLVVNRLLRWQVWNYCGEWGNLAGQICPKYSVLWFGLSLLVIASIRLLRPLRGNEACALEPSQNCRKSQCGTGTAVPPENRQVNCQKSNKLDEKPRAGG